MVQGNVFLFENTDCPQFVGIFGTCFGNNAAAPYVIPQPPVEDSYVDPYYAVPLNTPGPNGVTTNIAYRLSDTEALVSIVTYPPKAAYFGYQSYLFTSPTRNYPTADSLQVLSPNPDRFEIFGSVGNNVNNVIVQNQNGSPWNGQTIIYVSTSNRSLADDLVGKLAAKGIDRNSILVEKLGSNVRTGNGQAADDFLTLIRYALPEDPGAGDAWYANVSSNVLVFKVTAPLIAIDRYPVNAYTGRTGNDETQFASALDELASQLQTWSADHTDLGTLSAVSTSSFSRTTFDVGGVPHGLVGGDCIQKGTICAGDNQDTSTYAVSARFDLSATSILFVAGVDHNRLNNSSYVSLSIYNADEAAGVASASQANFDAVGFNSGHLTGSGNGTSSAEAVLRELGLYDASSPALKSALPSLYVSLVSKNCSIAMEFCVDLKGNSLIPDTTPPTSINMYERSYIRPGDTTGADNNVMVYPRVIGPGKE